MKRVLLFLLLLGLGITALLLAVGDEVGVRAEVDKQPAEPRPRSSAPGIPVQQGKVGASVSQTGYLRLPRYRAVALPNGGQRQEKVFELVAADSQPIGEGLQQLDGVELTLCDDGTPAATLTARQAFVELSRDANGRPSLREDKEVDLRDAVFTTLPGTRMAGLRLELGHAKVLVGEDQLLIRTAEPGDPVLLVVEGPRQGTLRGKGLNAQLPRSRSGNLQQADIRILSEPVFETAGIVVRARGAMHYVEDTAAGSARITVDDDVQLELAGGDLTLPGFTGDHAAAAPSSGVSMARGEQFLGWLLRSKERTNESRTREGLDWRLLQLTGAPASIDVPGARVVTPRITIVPGLYGDAFLVTAHGAPSRIEQLHVSTDAPTGNRLVGTSQRRIHLTQPAHQAGAAHRSFGFPRWTLGPLQQLQVLAFEGASRLTSGTGVLDASRGLHVFRSAGAAVDGGAVRGSGDVRVEQPADKPGDEDLVAIGNDGFWLHRTASARRLRLGPRLPADLDDPTAPWRNHRYDVRYGDAHVQGLGCCEVEDIGARTRLWLRAPKAEIKGRLAADEAELTGVRQLHALFEDREVLSLDVAGLPVRSTIVRGNDTLRTQAPRLVRLGPRSLRLLPVPDGPSRSLWAALSPEHSQPELAQTIEARPGKPGQQVTLQGPQLDIHHLGRDDVLVDATAVGDWRPSVTARFDQPDGRTPTTVFCHADRLRLLPFVLSPEVQQAHAGSALGPLANVCFHAVARPWLLVDDVREFHLEDERYGRVDGQGQRLLLSQGGEAALFIGDPDRMTPAQVRRTHEGRIIETRGARVRVFRDEDLRLQALRSFTDRSTFLLPSLTLHEPGKNGLLSHLRAVCRGNIDVLPEAVEFAGPVVAQGLREDGSEDPEGIHIEADTLRMQRRLDTGEIIKVIGRGVDLDWSGMQAHSTEAELDLRWNRLTVRDPVEAVVRLPDGRTWRSPFIEVNWDTMSVHWNRGRLIQQTAAQEVGR